MPTIGLQGQAQAQAQGPQAHGQAQAATSVAIQENPQGQAQGPANAKAQAKTYKVTIIQTNGGGKAKSDPLPTKERVTFNGRNAVVYMYKRGTVRYVKAQGKFVRL